LGAGGKNTGASSTGDVQSVEIDAVGISDADFAIEGDAGSVPCADEEVGDAGQLQVFIAGAGNEDGRAGAGALQRRVDASGMRWDWCRSSPRPIERGWRRERTWRKRTVERTTSKKNGLRKKAI